LGKIDYLNFVLSWRHRFILTPQTIRKSEMVGLFDNWVRYCYGLFGFDTLGYLDRMSLKRNSQLAKIFGV